MNRDKDYKSDSQTTLGDLRAAVQGFVAERDWESYHTPKNLAMSIAIEAAELLEYFQWSDPADGERLLKDPAVRKRVADELADVLIYSLSFANRGGIDLSRAVWSKLARNQVRFPVDQVLKGRLRPEDRKVSADGEGP